MDTCQKRQKEGTLILDKCKASFTDYRSQERLAKSIE